jgi:hypothetical protein
MFTDMRDQCDHCHRPSWPLYCAGCGNPAHGRCSEDKLRLGALCGECWAILSHVEGVLSCASACDCERLYADFLREARGDA